MHHREKTDRLGRLVLRRVGVVEIKAPDLGRQLVIRMVRVIEVESVLVGVGDGEVNWKLVCCQCLECLWYTSICLSSGARIRHPCCPFAR